MDHPQPIELYNFKGTIKGADDKSLRRAICFREEDGEESWGIYFYDFNIILICLNRFEMVHQVMPDFGRELFQKAIATGTPCGYSGGEYYIPACLLIDAAHKLSGCSCADDRRCLKHQVLPLIPDICKELRSQRSRFQASGPELESMRSFEVAEA